ncbi:hypothetical protein [Fimbriiglobus ruber]|uniref:Uncharacterized protein n=1 Tax=Fimbriiglobus ruber TaxID=1908690 RepID=A0A225DHD5_9BACT|nr:hypothetical protein [Fimbriiglobus ruber]OWK40413.1 hypothetical protein FRUB_05332 [Fimbriiglobus ruber]
MAAPPIDFDLACAVAMGFVEHPRMTANLHQLTVIDQRGVPVGTHRDWLSNADKLHLVTRDYLLAREDVTKTSTSVGPRASGWSAATGVKTRYDATTRAQAAKSQARLMLSDRGVFVRAKSLGFRVFDFV